MKTFAFSLSFLVASICGAEEFREFTNSAGRTIEASVKAIDDGQVTIAMKSGQEFTIPVTSLSQSDQEYLGAWAPSTSADTLATGDEPSVETLNEVIGHELFLNKALWESDPAAIAERLNWPRESRTDYSSSYRAYPKDDYRFLGARPFSAAMYGEGEGVTGISIVYANKGDFFGAKGSGEDHFVAGKSVPNGVEGLRMVMERDAQAMRQSLTQILGEPRKQKFGEGESRTYVERWDWAGHAFLLSEVEEEYVSLAIQTVEMADNRGSARRVADSTIREKALANLEKRDNGDVIIKNIPMVDQGPKGYCVPATAERLMRYLGIPADMYLLAMAGETRIGGGTSPYVLLTNIGSDIKRKGRSMEFWREDEIKLRDVKKYIDDGIPFMWALSSTSGLNEAANERMKMRKDADQWEEYKGLVAAAAEEPAIGPYDDSRRHVVIIVGYNEETNEIAFSDSWGERFLERWITIPEANQVSSGEFYAIEL